MGRKKKNIMISDSTKSEILKKYPPPKADPVFVAKWEIFLPNLAARENFNPSYLSQLEVLCDLYSEYDTTLAFIRKKGQTYKSNGRNGTQFKLRPEVMQVSRLQSEIRNYSKFLGLVIKKDQGYVEEPTAEDNWK